jgi:copper chaperone NosL
VAPFPPILDFWEETKMISTSPTTTAAPKVERVARARDTSKSRAATAPWFRLSIVLSGVFLLVSTIFAYWALTLHAPQYPGGLEVTIYTHEVTGDVREVDGLNHYIGMMPLGDAASLERSIASFAIVGFVILAVVAATWKAKWAPLLALPIVLFPFVFAVDLYFWLHKAGHDLDPTAALSSSVKPFTPAILGEGIVGQFSTTAMFGPGWFIALAGAILASMGIIGLLRGRKPAESS